jgi:tRNA pseudouridine55 synthase
MYRLKRLFPGQKIGHAGTLDPLASGVLVVGIGREATKKLHQEELSEKEYLATIILGRSSTTDDSEGEKIDVPPSQFPNKAQVDEVIRTFIGTTEQRPPVFSALKVSGTPAYKLARRGQSVELAARPAVIREIEVLDYHWPLLRIRVVTGRGVYIRSLARDIGTALGTAGYIESLERTRVGRFTMSDVVPLERLRKDS